MRILRASVQATRNSCRLRWRERSQDRKLVCKKFSTFRNAHQFHSKKGFFTVHISCSYNAFLSFRVERYIFSLVVLILLNEMFLTFSARRITRPAAWRRGRDAAPKIWIPEKTYYFEKKSVKPTLLFPVNATIDGVTYVVLIIDKIYSRQKPLISRGVFTTAAATTSVSRPLRFQWLNSPAH